MPVSKTQLDRVGARLRDAGDEDLVETEDREVYEDYRTGLADALSEVMAAVEEIAGSTPTSRFKTLKSTLAKLARQPHTRLSQIQDIVGCRVITANRDAQDAAVERICARFPNHQVDDRRLVDQNGYRAVHVIVRSNSGESVEIQVRTDGQNKWANWCESLADRVDPAFKYGGGIPKLREPLMALSAAMSDREVALTEAVHLTHEIRAAVDEYDAAPPSAQKEALGRELVARLPELTAITERIEQAHLAYAKAADVFTAALDDYKS